MAISCGGLDALGQDSKATVESMAAGSLGTAAFTANGRIHPHGLPTTYHFEYGTTAAYGAKAKTQALPPRLAAFYRESWDQQLGGWQAGMSGKDLMHHTEGGAAKGFVRFAEPSGDDRARYFVAS